MPPAGPPPPIPAPAEEAEPVRKTPGPQWLRRAMAEIEQGPEPPDAGPPRWPRAPERPTPDTFHEAEAPDRDAQDHYAAPETRPPLPSAPPIAPSRFDAIWPSDRRRGPEPPEKRIDPDFSPPGRQFERRPAPLVPPLTPPPPAPLPPPPTSAVESAPSRGDNREATILKSGMIDEMSYTLFTDGSIEAQMSDGTMHFASIDELRRHLEQQGE